LCSYTNNGVSRLLRALTSGTALRQTHKGETVPRRSRFPTRAIHNTRDTRHAQYISVAVGHIHQFSADYTNQYVRIWFPPGTAYRHLIFRHAPRLGKLRSRYMAASFGNRRRFFAALCTANVAGLFSPSSWRSSIRGNPPPIRIKRRPRSPREASG
jgi:hypothetical protein